MGGLQLFVSPSPIEGSLINQPLLCCIFLFPFTVFPHSGRPMSMLPNSSQEGAYRQTQTNTEYSIIYSLATREASKSITQLETTTTSRATSTRITVRFGPAGREPARWRSRRRRRRHPRWWTDSVKYRDALLIGLFLAPLLFGGILV